jgi:hypothetical protein
MKNKLQRKVIPGHRNRRSVPFLHDGACAQTNFLFLDTIDKSMYFTCMDGSAGVWGRVLEGLCSTFP